MTNRLHDGHDASFGKDSNLPFEKEPEQQEIPAELPYFFAIFMPDTCTLETVRQDHC